MKLSFGLSCVGWLLAGHSSWAFLPVVSNGSTRSRATPLASGNHAEDEQQHEIGAAVMARRSLLNSVAAGMFSATLLASPPALAGSSANIEMPNYIDFLTEKNNQGLAPDPAKVLYKGADPMVLLRRVQEVDQRLDEIASLVEQKKWSQINGVVTGPLGTLSQTLNQIATPDSEKAIRQASKKVKGDILAIGQASSQKNGPACVAATNQAIQDLEAFIKVSFCDNKTMVCFDVKNVQ